ncbi:long-chain-fatty-acid--CoA ligase 5-like isoform X2 [Convolutriloba macropyga]
MGNRLGSEPRPSLPDAYSPIKLPEKLTTMLPGPERIRISCLCEGGQVSDHWIPGLPSQTMYELFMMGHKISQDKPCLGYRQKRIESDDRSSVRGSNAGQSPRKTEAWDPHYTWFTYEEVRHTAHLVGSGFVGLGLPTAAECNVGIFAPNRPEWDITQLACAMFSYVVVPLYDTQSIEAQIHIINQTELKLICVDSETKLQKLLQIKSELPTVETLICFDDIISDSVVASVQAAGWKLMTFSQLKAFGNENVRPINPSKPDDTFIILYTSGTTGVPKGVVLKHKNVVSEIESIIRLFKGYENNDVYLPSPMDTYISYLPNAHGFNQVCVGAMFCCGAKVGYFRGDVKQLLEDAQALHPTYFPMVPRLMNRLYAGVLGKIKGNKIKELLMSKGLAAKKREVRAGIFRRNSFYDKLVFAKIQKMLGGSVRFMVTGAAPVSDEVMEFVKCAMGVPVFEGYGQSECTAAATLTLPGQASLGNVGIPLACCEIKLIDVPEMNYYAKDDKGEVCFRGTHCFSGYYKDEEKTRETIVDGWVLSGDIGEWTSEGTLKIIDRKKHIFKLAQGEYVAPEKVEGIYAQCPLVAQIYVHGESLEYCCVGVCIPEESAFRSLAYQEGITDCNLLSFSELCQRPKLVKAMLTKLTEHATEKKLNSLEKIRAIYLHDELLTPECGLLTPTLKSKRAEMAKYFNKQIKQMYARLAEQDNRTANKAPTPSKL